jgi:hypothetical protein
VASKKEYVYMAMEANAIWRLADGRLVRYVGPDAGGMDAVVTDGDEVFTVPPSVWGTASVEKRPEDLAREYMLHTRPAPWVKVEQRGEGAAGEAGEAARFVATAFVGPNSLPQESEPCATLEEAVGQAAVRHGLVGVLP